MSVWHPNTLERVYEDSVSGEIIVEVTVWNKDVSGYGGIVQGPFTYNPNSIERLKASVPLAHANSIRVDEMTFNDDDEELKTAYAVKYLRPASHEEITAYEAYQRNCRNPLTDGPSPETQSTETAG